MPGQGHYFSETPDVASKPATVDVAVAGLSFTLSTDAGVFSRDRLDPGTRILLTEAPLPGDGDTVLDLGCGYGPIACAAALAAPGARVTGVDVNARALDLLRANAAALSLPNVVACAPDEVDAHATFSRIYSNPPIRIGKQPLHDLLLRWLGTLSDEGEAYFVVQRNLGADSLAGWLGEQGYGVTRLASHRGYRVLRVLV